MDNLYNSYHAISKDVYSKTTETQYHASTFEVNENLSA